MLLFKFLSFCLGSATLGGTGAAIYYAINSKQNNEEEKGGQNKEIKGEVKPKVEEVEEPDVKGTVQSEEQTNGREAQTQGQSQTQEQTERLEQPTSSPLPTGFIGVGSEPSSTAQK